MSKQNEIESYIEDACRSFAEQLIDALCSMPLDQLMQIAQVTGKPAKRRGRKPAKKRGKKTGNRRGRPPGSKNKK